MSLSRRPLTLRTPLPLSSRFKGKYRVDLASGCWLWTATKTKGGYGCASIEGGRKGIWTTAHRVSWVLFRGLIPKGLYVLHKCDNPSCVNPEHLFLGTQKDNMLDMVGKGRDKHNPATGKRNGAYTHPEKVLRGDNHWTHIHPELVLRGENHPRAKLTWKDVTKIRRLYESGLYTYEELSHSFGVGSEAIKRIVLRESWKRVRIRL